jgi:putative DNA primase/helicase
MVVNMSSQPEALPYFVVQPGMSREEIQKRINALLDLPPEEEKPGPAAAVGEDGKRSRKKNDERETIATEELAGLIAIKHSFAIDAGGRLYVYENGCYRPRGADLIREKVKIICADLKTKWTSHRADETVKYLATGAPMLWERPPLDRVCVKNGILRLEDPPKLELHSPAWLSPIQLNVEFNPQASCPTWQYFIESTFPEDCQETAWEIPAWLLTPHTSLQKSVLLIGAGGSGKSVSLEALAEFLGRENCSTLSLQALETNRFAPAELYGKLFNYHGDLPQIPLETSQVFKQVTGNNEITAERKFGQPFKFRSFARMVFGANNYPQSADISHAFFRRWVVIPVDRPWDESPKKIPFEELLSRLTTPEELSGLLNEALKRLRRVQTQGFTEGESARRTFSEFRATSDPVATFLDENVVSEAGAYVPIDELYRAYARWIHSRGRVPITKSSFGRSVRRLRPGVRDVQRTVGGRVVWCYEGIGLRAVEEEA